jgi:MerR family transcriptional regulator, light-induced transcriptional regulator
VGKGGLAGLLLPQHNTRVLIFGQRTAMGIYSIKELERLSGIKAHTIRIWEKRYGVITPQRTSTNIRFYSDHDLKRIINVSLLNRNGVKISRIAEMSVAEIGEKIMDLNESKSPSEMYIDQLVVAMVDMDEESFESILSMLDQKFGFERSMTEVVYAFLEKIGVLWQTGAITPAHEHFISNLIRQKLIMALGSLPIPSRRRKKVMLFLPEGELHEIGLLYYHYIARSRGFRTFYLGQSVPYEDLKTVYNIHQPDVLITSMVSYPSASKLERYLKELSHDFSKSLILASGRVVRNTASQIPKNVKLFYKATELPALLSRT